MTCNISPPPGVPFFCWTRRSLFGPDGISLRGALEAGGPRLGAYPSRGFRADLPVARRATRRTVEKTAKRSVERLADLGLFVGFLSFNTLHWNFTGVSPECHQNVTIMAPEFSECHRNVTEMSPECHQNFAGILTWSILKKAITTTRPFHTTQMRNR